MQNASLRAPSVGRALTSSSFKRGESPWRSGRIVSSLSAPRRASSRDTDSLTNPFFYGKALAEVLNERMGRLAADTLAGVGTFEAEFRKAMDEIQEEVVERAQREIGIQNGGGAIEGNDIRGNRQQSGRAIAARTKAAATLDEEEIVDNLRAEIASTRSLIQQTKAAMESSKK